MSSGVLPPILLCLKEKEHNLKLYAISALNDMVKEDEDMAQTIVNIPETLPNLINLLSLNSTEIKVQVNY